MKNKIIMKAKALLIVALVGSFTMSVAAQGNLKVKVFSSDMANIKQMLVEKQTTELIPDIETENLLINVYPQLKYQEILGFGGAMTETSAYNLAQVSDDVKEKIIQAYFDKEKGLAVNFCRTHIHSSDFSLAQYTYVKDGDVELKTFNIDQDRKYILPMIKAAQKYAKDLYLLASPWSPPGWMKDTKQMIRGGKLLPEHYDTWARYMTKYFDEYKKEGIEFFCVSVQNEAKAVQTWESCIYSGTEEAVFATKNLRPTLDKSGFKDVKILVWDHNKERVLDRSIESYAVPGAKEAIWGMAFHWYSGEHFDNLRMAHEMFPDKPLLLTEYCRGGSSASANIPWGNWTDVEAYANELIGDFNNYMAAAIDWNMIVDTVGGPYHDRTGGCKAHIVVDKAKNSFTLEPTYYAVGHFSKFVKRGAKRIGTSSYNDNLKVTSFQNPNGEVVVVVLNKAEEAFKPKLRIYESTAQLEIPAKSLTTLIVPAK
jgi:O-Glycosyl hydrolase